MSELVEDVAREAYVADRLKFLRGEGPAPPERPDDVQYEWTWPQPENIDKQKENAADRLDLEMGTADYSDLLARRGQTLDGMIAKRKRTADKLKAAGLPAMPTIMPSKSVFASHAAVEAAAAEEGIGQEEDEDDEPDDRRADEDDDTAPDEESTPEDKEIDWRRSP